MKKYPISKIKDMYHARWMVEEYYKIIKTKLNTSSCHSKKENNVLQELFMNGIISINSKF